MIRKSSISVTYKDLIEFATRQLSYARQRKASSLQKGILNQEAVTHEIACAEKLVRMLERCEPGRQQNLFELFKETNK